LGFALRDLARGVPECSTEQLAGGGRIMATILIVDGLALNHGLIAQLSRDGHRLIEATDGEDMLETFRSERPDLILADILSPEPGGYYLFEHLRAEPVPAPLPRVILVSAPWLEAEARELAQACGVSKFFATHAEPGALLATINEALAAPQLPAPEFRPDPGVIGPRLHQVAGKLYQRTAELDRLAVRLNQYAASLAEQLEQARAALAQEVIKRLWAEQELTHANLGLREKALRDPLTGLYNRGYLEESLEREASRARRSNRPFGVMIIDIDHFKRCNDEFGHSTGDAVLRAVGQSLLSLARGEDIPCRYGGDEFVLLMAHASPATVRERAERLRASVQEAGIEHENRSIGPITLSIGIATFPECGDSGHAVLQAADAALYRAKEAGRNRVMVAKKTAVSQS
jgi:diguanylate cyclase (GGDEF)-like protein